VANLIEAQSSRRPDREVRSGPPGLDEIKTKIDHKADHRAGRSRTKDHPACVTPGQDRRRELEHDPVAAIPSSRPRPEKLRQGFIDIAAVSRKGMDSVAEGTMS